MNVGARARNFCILFLVLHLVPIWFFRYFPSKDGPTHLYNAVVLSQYADHSNYLIRSAYEVNLTVFPNWMYSLLAVPLLHILPPLIVEKIILTLAIGFFPLSFLYFHLSVNRQLRVFSFLGFLFSYNYLLIMGFFNFALGCSLLFVTLGYWYRRRDALSVRDAGVLYLLLLLLFLSHLAPYFLFLFCSSFLLLCRAVRKGPWSPGFLGQLRDNLKQLFEWTLLLVPAWFIFFSEAIKRARDPFYMSFAWLRDYFLHFKSLVYFTNYLVPWGVLLLVFFLTAVGITLYHWIRKKEIRDDSFDFLLLVAPLLAFYFLLPWGYGPGGWTNGGWGNDRIHLLLFLLISPWLNVEWNRWVRNVFAAILIVLSALHLGWTFLDMARIQPEIEQAQALCSNVREHSTFNGSGQSAQPGMSDFLSPAYCGLERRDLVFTGNYEAGVDLFPLIWKRAPEANPDYRIVWNRPPESVDAANQYETIARSERAALLRLRTGLEDQNAGGTLPLKFDIEPQPGLTPSGFISVGPQQIYHPGGFGWLTELRFPVTGRVPTGPGEGGMLIGDYLGAKEDGVFVITLPNGDYEVSSYFFSGDGGGHEVALIANDQEVIPDLAIPAGQYRREVYVVTVSDNRLVQVVYSRQSKSRNPGLHDHWIWSGFTLKPYRLP